MSKQRPYRVICRDTDPQWESERRKYLTATGVPKMLGLSPWATPEEYLENKRDPVPFEPTVPTLHGKFDERHNMSKFSRITGMRSRGTNLFLASTVYPGLACTIDGLVHRGSLDVDFAWCSRKTWAHRLVSDLSWVEGEVGLLEMKQTGAYKTRDWSNGPREDYVCQLRTQLHATGYSWGILCVVIGATDLRAYCVERDGDAGFTEELVESIDRFRTEVLDP